MSVAEAAPWSRVQKEPDLALAFGGGGFHIGSSLSIEAVSDPSCATLWEYCASLSCLRLASSSLISSLPIFLRGGCCIW